MNECTPTFEEAYARYRKQIRYLCLRMTKSEADAEELTQDVFLQLHRKLHTFKGDSAFYTWLHRMAINVVLMKLRKRRAPVISLDEMREHAEEEGMATFQEAIRYRDGDLEVAPERLTIQRAIDSLPHGYRTILILHDIENLEHNEIAEILGCSIGNSKSQLFKARTMIATFLQGKEKNRTERSLDSVFSDLEKYLIPEA